MAKSNVTMADGLNKFLLARASLAPRTLEWYDSSISLFMRWIDANHANWRDTEVIERFLADERLRVGPHTLAGRYRALKVFYGWLAARRYLRRSPMIDVRAPKLPKRAPRRAALAEYDQLLAAIPTATWIDLRDRLAISILFLCGLRASEVVRLEVVDFDLMERLLHVRAGKGGDRLIPVLPAVECAFEAYMARRPAWPSNEIFLSADGGDRQPMGVLGRNGLWQMLQRRCVAAGVRHLNPHSFRHGLAVYLLNSGGDMSLVQKILGHASIGTTATHYAQWQTSGLKEQFTRLMG